MPAYAPISSSIYNTIFRRNAAFLTSVFIGAFAFEMTFDLGATTLWDRHNKGRQWKDIKQRYLTKPEEEEDDDE